MTQKARGVDVSHHRGDIDWQQVKDHGITFGIIKTTDGAYFIDPKFDNNWTGLRRAGLLRGAYHFYRPATDPHVQAAHYLDRVGDILHTSDLPPVLDCEAYPSPVREEFLAQPIEERLDRIRIWLEDVRKATGRTPILYTNPATWQVVLQNDTSFSAYPLWIAHYGVSAPSVPAENWGGHGYTFWQQSYEGAVPGINNGAPPVDMNVYKAGISALHTWAGWSGSRPSAPTVTNAEMLTALRSAAETLQLEFEPWLTAINLSYLARQPSRPYDGPAFEEMTLPANQIALIEEILGGGTVDDVKLLPDNFTNQQMVNAVYQAAGILEMAGWQLLTLAGLTALVETRDAHYTGPLPSDLSGLDQTQRTTLNIVLGLAVPPADPVPSDPPQEPTPDPEPDPVSYPPQDPTPDPETDPVPDPPQDPLPEEPPTPEEPLPDEPPAPTETYPGKSNQDMINAFYAAAEHFNLTGWTLIEKAELAFLAQQREGGYQGPEIQTLSSISLLQQAAVAQALGIIRDGGYFDPPYPGLLNQDMINILYQAAQQHAAHGWQWLERTGLDDIAETQTLRYMEYRGPLIAEMPGLNTGEIDTLSALLTSNL